jgi:two-component system LytT family response regulator
MKLNCLIVDDEPLSLDVLEKYIQDYPELQLAGRCLDAFSAQKMLKATEVDLLFLDINMPKLSGINMVKAMDQLPEVIFTTAYPEYAVEGFELEVLDYLVKPISFERFVKTINKAQKKFEDYASRSTRPQKFMMVKSDKKLYKVPLQEIIYIQSMGDFVKILTKEKTYISSDTLKNIAIQLPDQQFVRIHKSYLISLMAFTYIEGNQVKIGDEYLPVGLTYKDGLLKALDVKNCG